MIKGPIFTGRTFREYLHMFNLNLENLGGRSILDCAAGASSFTPIMHSLGFNVKAVDILYVGKVQVNFIRCVKGI